MTDTTNAANSSPITAGAAGNSWKLVPTEPTEAMHVAAARTIVRCHGNDDFPRRVWSAMLAAAPQPQGVALTDDQIQQLWHEACEDGPGRPGWSRHIRFARAILAQSAPPAPQQAGDGLTEHQWHEAFAARAVNGALLNVRMAVEIVMEQLAAPRQPGEMGAGVHCRTCNDNGMIGGPTFYAPDEGGDPCPDCSCFLCNGSGVVPDGEITGVGGVEFSNGPIACVKDCPVCAADRKSAASAQQDEREAEWLTSKWCTVCKGATCLPGMHGLSEAVKQHVIAEFLQCTGQYVTNNASREAAIADAISKLPARTFEQAWAEKERQGYKYGNDALECVRMGWDMACASKPHAAQQVQANAGAVPFDIQDYEAFHADMDHQGVPRKTKFGVQLSAFGRAQYFAAMSRDTENGNV
ncbi:hypothetical protein Cmtc_08450 [Cupriavidus sp. TKC]|uniref:hypothetical protein n=1 Tax=Cupriavidus sp. TKC TaxID=2880159 RepID=UPI0025A6B101|nr:hypothetical protein [Cupriavidus sp. TKC]GMG89625.1 hypothetical protein Cmtc_08450 [Cupriavidus sp. TKC]